MKPSKYCNVIVPLNLLSGATKKHMGIYGHTLMIYEKLMTEFINNQSIKQSNNQTSNILSESSSSNLFVNVFLFMLDIILLLCF